MPEIRFLVENTALQTIGDLEIKANFEETKSALTEVCEPYKNLVVTEDELPAAKNDRAKIRKVEKQIDDYRKMVKQIYTEPLKVFEGKCKELTSICKAASDNIDVQVKELEEQKREQKSKEIESYFYEKSKEVSDYLSIGDIYNDRWENATYPIDKIFEEIDEAIEQTKNDIEAITYLDSEFADSLLLEYQRTENLRACIELNRQLGENKKKRIQEEQKKKIEEVVSQAAFEDFNYDIEEPVVLTEEDPNRTNILKLEVHGNTNEISYLFKFLDSYGIIYKVIV